MITISHCGTIINNCAPGHDFEMFDLNDPNGGE